jgi:hypothetical protein
MAQARTYSLAAAGATAHGLLAEGSQASGEGVGVGEQGGVEEQEAQQGYHSNVVQAASYGRCCWYRGMLQGVNEEVHHFCFVYMYIIGCYCYVRRRVLLLCIS